MNAIRSCQQSFWLMWDEIAPARVLTAEHQHKAKHNISDLTATKLVWVLDLTYQPQNRTKDIPAILQDDLDAGTPGRVYSVTIILEIAIISRTISHFGYHQYHKISVQPYRLMFPG